MAIMRMQTQEPSKRNNQRKVASTGAIGTVQQNDQEKYAKSSVANVPITKNSQFAGSGASVVHTQPMFFSPMHTPQNWQIASKRREAYQWSFINPCYITLYDGSIKEISTIYEEVKPNQHTTIKEINGGFELINGYGEIAEPDKISKRHVNKKANKVKALGTSEPLVVTHDHKCRIIKKEDIKCKYHNRKNCVFQQTSPTCRRYNCNLYKNVNYKISDVYAEDIEVGDYILIPFPTEIHDSVIETEDQARFAGHLAADGWYCDGDNQSSYKAVGICMNTEEYDYVMPTVNEIFNTNKDKEYQFNHSNNLIARRTYSTKTIEFGSKLIEGKGSSKKFTDQVFYLKPELQKHVIGAYIQSDGSYNKQNDVFEITTYSANLANQILLMCYRCGILARSNKQPISQSKQTFNTDSEFRYIINIPSSDCDKISEYVPGKSSYIRQRSKGSSWRFFWGNSVVARVSSNQTFDYEGFVYDIRVPNTYTVTVNNISVHQCRFYYSNEPKVAAGVDFYSQFPMTGFTLECSNTKILEYFDAVAEDLDLQEWLNYISHEYFLLGDVFPFLEIDCPVCFLSDTMVLTRNGNKPIQDISVGEEVLTIEGEYKEVIRRMARKYKGNIIDIKLQSIPNLKSTDNHKHYVVRPSYRNDNRVKEADWNNPQQVKAKDIKPGDYVACPFNDFLNEDITEVEFDGSIYRKKNKEDAQRFNIKLTEEFADFIGWYVAEGSTDSNRSISLTLNGYTEQSVADSLTKVGNNIFNTGFHKEPHWWNKESVVQVCCYSRELAGWLDDHCGHGSHNKRVPWFIMNAPKDVKRAFINACLAGDGHIRKNRNECKITTTSRQLCFDMVSLLADLGESCFVSEKEAQIDSLGIKRKHSYSINWRTNPNKKNGQGTHKEENHIFFKVKEVNVNEKQTIVYNLTVEDYHNYVANFVHTRNCGGQGVDPETGERCNHPGGNFSSIRVMNPDYVEVQDNVLAKEPVIAMQPDEELQMIVQRRQPKQIYDNLPDWLIELVASGQPIPLSSRSVSHLKHNASPYGTYGESLLRRLFTVLAYKTKIMTANWIVAERMILPVRVVKVGDKDRPATEEDILDVQNQLSAVANDPNLTIVTHHAFEYDWYGACYDEQTEFLDKHRGFVKGNEITDDLIYENISTDDFEIMVFDPNTGEMRYEKPLAIHVYDYNGFLVGFEGNKIDMAVTPNHTMLGYKRDKETAYALEARDFAKLNEYDRHVRCVADYDAESAPAYIDICGHQMPINEFLQFAGYYLAEGYSTVSKRRNLVSVSQSFEANPDYCSEIDNCFDSLDIEFSKYEYEGRATSWNILNKEIAEQISDWFGHSSNDKKIPHWIKNLPAEKLNLLVQAYSNGDASKFSYISSNAIQIGSNSEQLIDDFNEILFKCGYAPVKSLYQKSGTNQYMLYCNLTDNGKGRFPRIKDNHIHAIPYNGKVWCFETSTGFFVTRRNGKIAIQGNTGKIHNISNELELIGKELLDGMMLNQALLNGEMANYSSAQVGVETMIKRLEVWRLKLKKWVEQHIFKPIAMMQGFIDEEKSKRTGRTEYIYPTLKWNDLNLRDNTNYVQLLLQVYDKGGCSMQTILEELGLDYDTEVERLRQENIVTSMTGQMTPGGDMGGGGAMGGGPPMGGGDMGGGPPMGGAPGGDMGGGAEMGGAPGGDMGGGDMGGAAAQQQPKVTKRGKQGQQDQNQQQEPQQKTLQLTKLEATLYEHLKQLNMPFKLFGQYTIHQPGEQQPFVLDFAYPEIGIGIECLHPDTWVPTKEGVKRAKDITIDDNLIGKNGDPVNIKSKIYNYCSTNLYRINSYGMLPVDVTGNHPFLVSKPTKQKIWDDTSKRNRQYYMPSNFEYVNANNLENGDYLVIPKDRYVNDTDSIKTTLDLSEYKSQSHNGHDMPEQVKLDSEMGWLLGIYAAEGNSGNYNSKNKTVTFSLHINEIDIAEKIQNIIHNKFNLSSNIYIDKNHNCMRVSISSTQLGKFFSDNFGYKAPDKSMPSWLFETSRECREEFLRAFSLGDGCNRNDHINRHISSSEKLIVDGQALAFSLGYFSAACKSREENTVSTFTRVSKEGELYNDSYNTRGLWEFTINYNCKNKVYREDDKFFYVPITSVEEINYQGYVINFETEGNDDSDHTYLVSNICSHNCDGAIWHERADLKQRDHERDQKLASSGWRILRFTEQAVYEHIDTVMDIIYKNIAESAKKRKKQSRFNDDSIIKEADVDIKEYVKQIEANNKRIELDMKEYNKHDTFIALFDVKI